MKKLIIKKSDLTMLLFGAFIISAGWFCSSPEVQNIDEQFKKIEDQIKMRNDSIGKSQQLLDTLQSDTTDTLPNGIIR